MHKIFKTLKGMMAVAAVAAVAASGTASLANAQASPAAAKQKNWKDQAEYDMAQAVIKDLQANNATKAITDLDAWKSKYAQTDFKELRDFYYIQAYSGAKQFNKVLETAGPLLDQLDTLYPDPKDGAATVIRILYSTVAAIPQIPNPTPAETATGEKAAKLIQNLKRKPEGMPDADWATTRTELQKAAKGALLYIAVVPGTAAMAKKDCQTAETVFTRALSDYPDNAWLAYQLGQAINCVARADRAKYEEINPRAIYAFVRAVVIDPTLGGTQNGQTITEAVNKTYINFHGDSEGLDQLKQQAKASPLPPAGFAIESTRQVAERKEKEFKEKYPQLAMWLGIKGQLSGAEGEAYFTSQMKETAIPKGTLKGMIVEGKPACRSKELLVSVPEPDQKGTAPAVITLKLEAPLKGKPELTEIQFGGVPSAFTKESFMLTMDVEQADITDLKVTPCTPAPAPKGGSKKGPASKKK